MRKRINAQKWGKLKAHFSLFDECQNFIARTDVSRQSAATLSVSSFASLRISSHLEPEPELRTVKLEHLRSAPQQKAINLTRRRRGHGA